MPYRETAPFSLTLRLIPPLSLFLSLAFSARSRSSSACISVSLIAFLPRFLPRFQFISCATGRTYLPPSHRILEARTAVPGLGDNQGWCRSDANLCLDCFGHSVWRAGTVGLVVPTATRLVHSRVARRDFTSALSQNWT